MVQAIYNSLQKNFARLSREYCEALGHIHSRTLDWVMGLLFTNPWWCYFPTIGCAIPHYSIMYTLLYSSRDSLLRCLHNQKNINIKRFMKLHTQACELLRRSNFPIPSRRIMSNLQTFIFKPPPVSVFTCNTLNSSLVNAVGLALKFYHQSCLI